MSRRVALEMLGAGGSAEPGSEVVGASVEVHPDSGTMTVHVPLKLHRRGGRKLVMAADGSVQPTAVGLTAHNGDHSPLVKALARAFRWQRLLEDGVYASCADLAAAEKINPSYVSRVLRLTLLAPERVEAILDEKQPLGFTLEQLLHRLPVQWKAQTHFHLYNPRHSAAEGSLLD